MAPRERWSLTLFQHGLTRNITHGKNLKKYLYFYAQMQPGEKEFLIDHEKITIASGKEVHYGSYKFERFQ